MENSQGEYYQVHIFKCEDQIDSSIILDHRFNRPIIKRPEDLEKYFVMQEIESSRFSGIDIPHYKISFLTILLSTVNDSLGHLKKSQLLLEESGKTKNKNYTIQTQFLCDYIQHFSSAIIFSYTAIEAIANLVIPPDIVYEKKKNNKGVVEKFDRNSFERYIGLSEKIVEILRYYKVDPLGKQRLDLINQLEQIRNEIIHQKADSRKFLYKNLFRKDILKIINACFNIIPYITANLTDKVPLNVQREFPFLGTWDKIIIERQWDISLTNPSDKNSNK
jgi:hypothetical protein